MFYQNNNDYMRDAFYYSQPQNNTYPYNGMNNMNSYMPQANMQNGMPQTNMQNSMQYQQMNPYMNSNTNVENMYPQVYRIIDPVARRVISNNNYPYYNEDNLNNMVDTVYNIVEGDVSTLSSTETSVGSDDTVTQGASRTVSTNNGTRQTMAENTRTTTNTVTTQTSNNSNNLLKDLIKIIIIKELLTRTNRCNNNNMNPMSNMTQNFYDPRYMGMI